MTISIANRILLGFAVIVALMVGLGVYALNQLDDVRLSTETIVTRDLALMRQIGAGDPPAFVLTQTLVLGFPAMVGGAAGRIAV